MPGHGARIVIGTQCLNSKLDGKQPSLTDRIYSTEGASAAVTTTQLFMGNIAEETKIKRLRIRKLTEGECMRLMGFQEKDVDAMRKAGLSKSTIYHSAGDSIVTTVLMGIFGTLLEADYSQTIIDYTDSLHQETKTN